MTPAAERLRARRVDHPMKGGGPAVIGPPRHQLADVHHERSRHDRHLDPFPSLVAHLEAAGVCLGLQDREASVVRMRARAGAGRARRLRLLGIVADAQPADVPVHLVVEEALRLVEGRGEQAHDLLGANDVLGVETSSLV